MSKYIFNDVSFYSHAAEACLLQNTQAIYEAGKQALALHRITDKDSPGRDDLRCMTLRMIDVLAATNTDESLEIAGKLLEVATLSSHQTRYADLVPEHNAKSPKTQHDFFMEKCQQIISRLVAASSHQSETVIAHPNLQPMPQI